MSELIVHYGLAKTGTTAVQLTLYTERARLLERGLLYPDPGAAHAHHSLTPLFQPFEDLHPDLRNRSGQNPELARAKARRLWEQIKREVDRSKPGRILLSSEMFFTHAKAEGQERFRELLSEISPSITTCVYIRSPAPHFLSLAQQSAKSSDTVGPPRPLSVRGNIEVIEAAFGDRMIVRPFASGQLQDGDVVADILARVVGMPELVGSFRSQRVNESITAEVMAIASAHRGASCPGLDGVQVAASRLLVSRLNALEHAAGRTARPVLKPGIASAIERASSDLHWLRERYGIEFEDVDYALVDGTPLDGLAGLTRVADICEVDEGRRDELLYRLLEEGLDAELRLAQVGRIVPHDRLALALQRFDRAFGKATRGLRRLRSGLI